ncbi:hypothetical protein GEMRC1_011489 [Eukaryota sp. GEM-RC1]
MADTLPLNPTGQTLLNTHGHQHLLNCSLSEICTPSLPTTFSDSLSLLSTSIVVELLNFPVNASESKEDARNVSSSLVKPTAVLRCTITDGFSNFLAMNIIEIPGFHLNLLPGTKLLVKKPQFINKVLILDSSTTVLGGRVPHFVEKYAGISREERFRQMKYLQSTTDSKRPLFEPIPTMTSRPTKVPAKTPVKAKEVARNRGNQDAQKDRPKTAPNRPKTASKPQHKHKSRGGNRGRQEVHQQAKEVQGTSSPSTTTTTTSVGPNSNTQSKPPVRKFQRKKVAD